MGIGARFAAAVGVAVVSVAAEAQEIAVSGLGRVRATFDEPFSSVRALREEADGRVLVIDDIENRILRVDLREGTATVIGRQGNGPGEYTLPVGLLALDADTTLAVDLTGGGRALLIVARGASGDRLAARGIAPGAPLFFRPDVQADARGNLYELVMLTAPEDRAGGYSGIRRLDRASGRQDTIGRVSQQGRSPLLRPMPTTSTANTAPRAAGPPPPYATVDQWAVAADGRVAIVTVDPYRVVFIDPSGGRVEGPVLQYRPVPMSAGLKAEWRVRQEQPVLSLRMNEDRTMSPGRSRRTYVEPTAWPDVLPPFLQRALRFAPDGMLWIERAVEAGAGQSFDVIDARGRLVRHVRLDAGLRLVGFGRDGVYTVRHDADDLEYLQLHHLQP
ncbi:MAG TPA: hypothetical protein PLY94_09120 [Gemmatimonadaceae bacterium]|nr:hypothetical protein [Gemmatimonadaceae bacterium]